MAALSGLLILALGIFQLVMLATRGQSIGKRLLGIRIVTYPEGQNPGGVKTILLRGVVPAVIGMIPVLGPLFSLVNVCFIFREDRRCIHDLIAGTQVVNGQPPQ
ncbi:MAG: RDD family protein [Verrucomicrobiaceae bacterium]|nr:RDD family protein [Verrucomicrobiaceae bacterium]